MADRRVRASPTGAPRPTLIEYPRPAGFPEPAAAVAAEPASHADDEADLGDVEPSVGHEEVGESSYTYEDDTTGGAEDATPEPTLASPSAVEKAQSVRSKLLSDLSKNAMLALRGSVDDGPMVEDHVLETMDFDKDEDYVNEDFMEKKHAIHRHVTLLLQFFMTVLIAFVTAMGMFCVSHLVELLWDAKVDAVLDLIEDDDPAGAYFTLLAISLAFVIVSSVLVAVVAPHARGGGVPFVMAYLNGTNVMEHFSLRIVLVKTASLIFTITGGLTLGMEGPFVFIGGGVAAILTSATKYIFPFFPHHSSYAKILRSIREERIFMAGGMAAGLAVAFDAPIAGVLFALEGATAFLSAPVVLRIFGCAMFASFFNDLGHTYFSKYIKNHNLLEVSNSGTVSSYAWQLPELLPFIIIGLVGGVMGAMATRMNMAVSRWRHHYMQGSTWKDVGKQVLEIMAFCLITVSCWFAIPYIYGCRAKHSLCDVEVSALPTRCRQAHCAEGYYSEAATIVYSTSNEIAALLFDRSLEWSEEFHAAPLITYGLIYFVLVATIYGAYVPGGLFVPSIVVGGVYGRVIGIACEAMFLSSGINPGIYSLLGAASMLGGFTRLALPVVIMLVELTGDATYLLPMMLCSAIGKFLSDYIEPPLYPQHMALEKIPSLTDKLNPAIAKLTAKQIMLPAEKCFTMSTIERLSHVKNVLEKSKRVVFPLITPAGTFAGLILTRNVMFCLTDAPTYSTFQEAQEQVARDHGEALRDASRKNKRDWHNDKRDYSSTITRSSAEFEDLWINFTPYMDAGCLTARTQTPAKRLAALFRRVGLSHLCITDKDNVFRGLITRRSLITPPGAPVETHGHGHGHGHASEEHAHEPTRGFSSSSVTASRKGSHAPSVQSIDESEEEQKSAAESH